MFRPGAGAPLVAGRTGDGLAVPTGVYRIRVGAGPEATWREGVAVAPPRTTVDVEWSLPELDEPLPESDAPLFEGDAPPRGGEER